MSFRAVARLSSTSTTSVSSAGRTFTQKTTFNSKSFSTQINSKASLNSFTSFSAVPPSITSNNLPQVASSGPNGGGSKSPLNSTKKGYEL
eukprot:TRINITY_DN10392_c0_g1_i2.p1 TRINITY_DN10392_c0_g1~~TRINITY_DN10392_c0_g1_i2.p1  ORF type:complete len:90 (-),score=6.74 TRINITY_DN10392_c0_g1_i2:35-304(-)